MVIRRGEEEASAAEPKRPKYSNSSRSVVFVTMKNTASSESSTKPNTTKSPKPPFKPAKDDTKPVLQDPMLRSDPIETEEALLRLPPFSIPSSTKS